MKSRRVLQVFVAVLSIILLACLALMAVLTYLADLMTFLPEQIVGVGKTFGAGLKEIADVYKLYDWATPAIFFGVPGGALLLAAILILTKNKGKDGKNIAGCIFALIGAVALAAMLIVFAKSLFAAELLLIIYCVAGGELALVALFAGLALGIKGKQEPMFEELNFEQEEAATTAEARREESEESEVSESAVVESEEVATKSNEKIVEEGDGYVIIVEEDEDEAEVEEEPEVVEEEEPEAEVEEEPEAEEEVVEEEPTPATEYVPHYGYTVNDIVARTYGKQGVELTPAIMAKIRRVRALYEANAISEQEYIKLINKYLGF